MTFLDTSPAKAGGQVHCGSLARIIQANPVRCGWAPAFAGEASGIGQGYH